PHLPGMFFEVLHTPSVSVDSLVLTIDQVKLGEDPNDWRTPFVKYIKTSVTPRNSLVISELICA
ncbi:hypothetical protein N1031_20380, partial [Herbiconiux moechotypicola]|nr:hypothetical protein [Herbiconiux moechotypicola]